MKKDVYDDIFPSIKIRRTCLNCIKRDTEECECKGEEMYLETHPLMELDCCVLKQDNDTIYVMSPIKVI